MENVILTVLIGLDHSQIMGNIPEHSWVAHSFNFIHLNCEFHFTALERLVS